MDLEDKITKLEVMLCIFKNQDTVLSDFHNLIQDYSNLLEEKHVDLIYDGMLEIVSDSIPNKDEKDNIEKFPTISKAMTSLKGVKGLEKFEFRED